LLLPRREDPTITKPETKDGARPRNGGEGSGRGGRGGTTARGNNGGGGGNNGGRGGGRGTSGRGRHFHHRKKNHNHNHNHNNNMNHEGEESNNNNNNNNASMKKNHQDTGEPQGHHPHPQGHGGSGRGNGGRGNGGRGRSNKGRGGRGRGRGRGRSGGRGNNKHAHAHPHEHHHHQQQHHHRRRRTNSFDSSDTMNSRSSGPKLVNGFIPSAAGASNNAAASFPSSILSLPPVSSSSSSRNDNNTKEEDNNNDNPLLMATSSNHHQHQHHHSSKSTNHRRKTTTTPKTTTPLNPFQDAHEDNNDDEDDEQHIAEKLAAAALEDSDDDLPQQPHHHHHHPLEEPQKVFLSEHSRSTFDTNEVDTTTTTNSSVILRKSTTTGLPTSVTSNTNNHDDDTTTSVTVLMGGRGGRGGGGHTPLPPGVLPPQIMTRGGTTAVPPHDSSCSSTSSTRPPKQPTTTTNNKSATKKKKRPPKTTKSQTKEQTSNSSSSSSRMLAMDDDDDDLSIKISLPTAIEGGTIPLPSQDSSSPQDNTTAIITTATEATTSATAAIQALPAQEVSISANTTTHTLEKATPSSSTTTFPLHNNNNNNKKGGKQLKKLHTKKDKTTATTTTKKGKSRKKKGLSGDDAANQKAARLFNRSVRACVDKSDPDAMRDILHDKRNHNFALDKSVLETVMKAYVMAAMFDDALYCLRNCALPGTLSCVQTERILTCLPQNLRNSSAFTAADMINALCIATEFDQPTSRTYFMRIVRGIALEFLEEATSARDRICSAPCERLVRSAQCVVDAKLKRGKKASDLVVQPGHQLGVFVPDTLENRGIQAGDAVSILPYAGPYPMSAESLDRNMIEATVSNAQPLVLRLQDKTNAGLYAMLTENVDGNVYRIDKLANRMGFNRQLASAVSLASPLEKETSKRDTKRPSPELIRAITAMDENIDRVMRLGNFHNNNNNSTNHANPGELTSTAALCSQAVPWSSNEDNEEDKDNMDEDRLRGASRLALEKYGALEGLNESQRLAVEGAATNRLTLVQGPPGTGKTAVAIRILQHWARLASSEASGNNSHNHNNNNKEPTVNPILATSDSNIAVDNLVEGCANVGLRVVRLGRPEAIRPELLRYCIDRPPSSGYGNNNNNNNNGGNNNNNNYSGTSATAFKEKMKILKNAQVICCTCIGSGGDILDNMTFERVLVDEATQATEPAVLVPLTRSCRQLVLVGDHCQLPPTVLSTRAEEEGLGVPLFSRMVACGVPPFMLDTQYRMHPAIAMFPSDLFYGGKLRNGVSPPERRPLAGFPWPREEFPVAFVPVQSGVELDDGVSKLNEAEAAAACDAVAALLAGGQCTVSDIAVVTPYAAQARLIRRMTRQLTQGPPYVEVSSTDGFQGREKEAVVFSAVRSNGYGTVGFVSDWRRVNVSFTRARRALIVIGNDQTLRRGDPDTWMPWLAWADAHGVNMDKPGIPRGRYEPEQLRRVRGGTTAAEMLKDVLARQQAQLKTAEKQLEKAEKNAQGHIMGTSGDDEDDKAGGSGGGGGGNDEDGRAGQDKSGGPRTLEEDLQLLSNTDGCWDDSDDEGKLELHHSVSVPTLTTVSSSNDIRNDISDEDEPIDAWDL
jgi:hypothetical protein